MRLAMPPAVDRDPPRGTGLVAVLWSTISVQVVATWAMLSIAAIAPLVADALGVPPVLIGYQISIMYSMAMLMSLLAGALTQRWGACRMTQVCALACAAGCLLIGAWPSVVSLALGSIILGLAYGIPNPPSTHLLARYSRPANRSFVFSLKQTAVPIGGVTAGLLTPWLAVAYGWSVAVLTLVPLALVAMIALQPRRAVWDDDRTPGSPLVASSLSGTRQFFADPALRALGVCGFCFAPTQLCSMAFIVAMAVGDLGFDALLAGALLATLQGAGIIGRMAWGYLADRLRRNTPLLVIIGGISASCCLAFSLIDADSPRMLPFLIAAVLGMSAIGWNGVFIAEVVRLGPPEMVGRLNGVSTFINFAGVLIGPVLFVQVYGWLGTYTSTYAALAVPALIGGLAAGVAGLRGRHRKDGW